MGRTQKAYEAKFRALLSRLRARRVNQGVDWLLSRATRMVREDHLPLPQALTLVYRSTLQKIDRWQTAQGQHISPGAGTGDVAPVCFWCDAGLGGLARWLRAAGYEAEWTARIDDGELLRRAQSGNAVLVTTDSLLMERRLVRDWHIPALWVPPSLKPLEQLALVLEELRLPLRDSLCMNCGGRMDRVEKEAMRELIPPRTYKWLDEYFLCRRCGRLFWHGTHWRGIQRHLEAVRLAAGGRPAVTSGPSGSMEHGRQPTKACKASPRG